MAGIDFIHQNGIDYEIVPEIAPLFKTTQSYTAGQHVIYEAGLYTFKADKSAGAWDATKVDGPFKVTDRLSDLKEDLNALKDGVSYTTTTTTLEVTSSNQSIKTDGSFANAGGYSLRVDAEGITKMQFNIGNPMKNPSNPYPVTAFVDENGNVLKQTVAGTYSQATWYTEDVPYGARYFYINTWTTNATIRGITITYSIPNTIMNLVGNDVDAIQNIIYVVPVENLVQGAVNSSGIVAESRRLTLKDTIPVKVGDIITFASDNLYGALYVRTNPPTEAGTSLQSTTWKKQSTIVSQYDGYLCLMVANASNYDASTAIVPQDYTTDGAITTKFGDVLGSEFVAQSKILTNTFISDYNDSVYKSYVSSYVAKLLDTSQDTEQFLFYTDPHIAVQYGNINDFQERTYTDINFIEAIYNASPISFFLSGGDWLGHGDTPETAVSKLSFLDGFMRKKIHNYYPMLGNHDVNEQGVANVGDQQGTGKLDNATLTNVWQIFREHQQLYYAVDAPNSKVYVFNTGGTGEPLSTYQIAQLKWFAGNLENDNSEHIILAMHILYLSITNNTIQPIAEEILQIAQAYNDRTTIYVDDEEFDFTTSTGTISFCIAGHAHQDATGVLYDIPYVLSEDGTAMNTSDKLCTLDLCIADWTNQKLHMVRVGDGIDRTIDIL